MSNFSVDSEVSFVIYACFTVLYCCTGHYAGNYYVDIINSQFDRLFRQANEFTRNILPTIIVYLKASADVNISTFSFSGEKLVMRLWITKWTFNCCNGCITVILPLRWLNTFARCINQLSIKFIAKDTACDDQVGHLSLSEIEHINPMLTYFKFSDIGIYGYRCYRLSLTLKWNRSL